MKKKNLWLMAGPAGSGKSTWAKRHMPTATIISRDQIRFELLKEEDDYFAYEDIVLRKFYQAIQNAIDDPTIVDIVVDATHLTPKARRAVLVKLHGLDTVTLGAISVEKDLETCLTQNAQRTGRAFVPEATIKNMYKNYIIPTEQEGFINIIHVRKENDNE